MSEYIIANGPFLPKEQMEAIGYLSSQLQYAYHFDVEVYGWRNINQGTKRDQRKQTGINSVYGVQLYRVHCPYYSSILGHLDRLDIL